MRMKCEAQPICGEQARIRKSLRVSSTPLQTSGKCFVEGLNVEPLSVRGIRVDFDDLGAGNGEGRATFVGGLEKGQPEAEEGGEGWGMCCADKGKMRATGGATCGFHERSFLHVQTQLLKVSIPPPAPAPAPEQPV